MIAAGVGIQNAYTMASFALNASSFLPHFLWYSAVHVLHNKIILYWMKIENILHIEFAITVDCTVSPYLPHLFFLSVLFILPSFMLCLCVPKFNCYTIKCNSIIITELMVLNAISHNNCQLKKYIKNYPLVRFLLFVLQYIYIYIQNI